MIKISTSILSSEKRIESIQQLNNTDCDYIHIDVMDNNFVPNYQLPINEVNELAKYSKKKFDIHLMVNDPEAFIDKIKFKNIHNISFHVEIDKNIDNIINKIKRKGYKVGLAIKPNTPLNILNKYLDKIDILLIMSVEPGFGGQKFIESTIDRIKQIRNTISDILIEVDGGINGDNINNIKYLIDIAVVGNYITKQDNYQEAINKLKK